MAQQLELSKAIAIDIEAHSEHSYEGFACLLQISTAAQDYVVDCVTLRSDIGPALRAVCADPAVRKIFHSCEGVDIPRLDRDFGIRVVNCSDTQCAAKFLKLPLGLVDLLVAGGVVDAAWAERASVLKRRFQNCDWRERPLSSDQIDYARGDATHLLALDAALWNKIAEAPALARAAFADAQAAPARALWRPPRSSALAADRDKRLPRDDRQARRFVDLYAWRDAAARLVDESPHAVCPATALIAYAKHAPGEDALAIAFEPIPPYIACDAFGLRVELLARIGRWN
jgi:exosome complex exonuclease RRP6